MTGFLAYSLAGHDKGKLYLIIEETGDLVYAVDGAVRTLDRPPKHHKSHMQLLTKGHQGLDISSVTNEEIKHFIKLYLKDIKEVK